MRKKSISLSFSFIMAFGAVALAACGGGSEDDGDGIVIPPSIDAAPLAPDASNEPFTCDPIMQDCANPDDTCTVKLTQMGNMSDWNRQCVAPMGTVAAGQSCMRNPVAGAAGVGNDNCAKGLYCTALGNLDGSTEANTRQCRTFCRAGSGNCAAGETCFQLTQDIVPNEGICISACDPTVRPSTTCTGGAWCQPASAIDGATIGLCDSAGTVPLGGTCGDMMECAANLLCVINNMTMEQRCEAVCDMAGVAVTCPAGEQCNPIGGFPTDWGVCGPPPM